MRRVIVAIGASVLVACAGGGGDNPGDGDGGGDEAPSGDTATEPEPTDEPEPVGPAFGVARVNADGVDWVLELENPAGLYDGGVSSLEIRAEQAGGAAELDMLVLSPTALQVGTYDLGVWGSPTAERTDIGLRVFYLNEELSFLTPDAGSTTGSLTIGKIDRVGGRLSLTFAGQLEKVRVASGKSDGMVTVTGSITDVPMDVY